MSKVNYYFDVNEIKSITLTFEEETDYKWREEVPSKPRYILGFIPWGKTKLKPACWVDSDTDYWGTSDEKLKSYGWLIKQIK